MNGNDRPERMRMMAGLGPITSFDMLGQGVFSSVNWLWIAGSVCAAWMLVGAMNRRQIRLTGILREHVQKHKDAVEAMKPKEDDKPTPAP